MPELSDLPLRDIHLPDPISWWPLAFGWWGAIAVVLLFTLGFGFLAWKVTRTTLKKEALKEIDKIESQLLEQGNALQCLSELSIVLRRIKLSQKNSKHAGLTGESWLKVLDETLGGEDFRQGIGRLLLTGPYLPQAEKEDVADLIQLCRKWALNL